MNSFFVYLDILGFKNLVANNTTQRLEKIIKSFWDGFNKTIDESRTIPYKNVTNGTNGEWKISLDKLNFRLLSDSILIWSEDESFQNFRNILEATSQLLAYGLQNGFPLRGAMTYGEVIVQRSNNSNTRFLPNESIYGKALVETYSIEEKMEWSGCIMTSNAWKQVCKIWDRIHANDSDPNSYFTKHPHLVWYPIPFKDSPQAGIAINWNSAIAYDSEKKIDPYLVQNSFYAYGKGFPPNTKKQDETLKFLNYTTQLQDYCFLSSREESQKRRKTIPIPCDDYKI